MRHVPVRNAFRVYVRGDYFNDNQVGEGVRELNKKKGTPRTVDSDVHRSLHKSFGPYVLAMIGQNFKKFGFKLYLKSA